MRRAVIFLNGRLSGTDKFYISQLQEEDFIIAVDGGTDYAYQLGVNPDLICGDLDSISNQVLKFYRSQENIEWQQHPCCKDKTDAELALETAITKGYRDIVIYAAVGARIDHTLANLYLLEKLDQPNLRIKLISANERIELITDERIINNLADKTVSLLPITDQVTGVSLYGFKYELSNQTINRGETLGISNIITNQRAVIEVNQGKIMMIINLGTEDR
ncbi:MAG: thiamine diphosphokinase [Bacillota bacterium]